MQKRIEVYYGSVVVIPDSFIGTLFFHYVGVESFDFDVNFDGFIKNHVLVSDDSLDEQSLCLSPVLKAVYPDGFQLYRFNFINFNL